MTICNISEYKIVHMHPLYFNTTSSITKWFISNLRFRRYIVWWYLLYAWILITWCPQWLFSFPEWLTLYAFIQFSSVAQPCPTLCDPMNRSTPGPPVHHHLPEVTQTHVHRVRDAIQPSHPGSSPSPDPNLSQHQSLFQWVNSSHEVPKVLEFQL